MNFFQTKTKKDTWLKPLLFLAVFCMILLYFSFAASSWSSRSTKKQQELLTDALTQGTVQYYALEGYYPENLDDLVQKFNISYDSSRFLIDYRPVAANIMPEITVLARKQVSQ